MTDRETESGKEKMEERAKEMRAEMLEKIEARAQAAMNDERYDRLRTQTMRRILSALLVLSALLIAVTGAMDGGWLLLNLILFGGLWFLVGKATRGFTDFPDELVDERIRSTRNKVYRYAYISVVAFLALVVVIMALGNIASLNLSLTGDQLFAGAMALFWLSIVTPAVIFAWTEPEL